jgi:hypothetical protein
MNSILARLTARFQTLTGALQSGLIADKTLERCYGLINAALNELHLIIQQQLLDFLGSLYGKARHASNATATRDYMY